MIVRNYTPFVPLFFESRDVQGREFCVFVLRGTFDIIPYAAIRPNPKQRPIVETDIYHGEVNASSVYMESDLAPFKPRSDIHINATAHAPGGRALPDWQVRVRVGTLEKTLRVTGPRQWVRDGGSYRLTEPEPCLEVPIRYERAFGGTWTSGWRESSRCAENPIGVGYVGEDRPSYQESIPAPQIESLEDPIGEFGKVHRPEGLGPIARGWQPRLKLAGTFDEAWRRDRWPELPEDFDFAHYNSAHPDLICPGYLRGDERITLDGLHPGGEFRFYLPDYQLALLLRLKEGAMVAAPMLLDTTVIDVPESRTHLIWRSTFAKSQPIRVLEARMTQPDRGRHG